MDNEIKDKLKSLIRRSKILTYFYEIRCNIKQKKMLKAKNIEFSKNGKKVFSEFLEICNKLNIKIFLVYGTLLGYVRENGLLKHDFDFDVGVFSHDYNDVLVENLIKNGFVLVRQFVGINYEAYEQTFEKDGVSIDIFHSYTDNKKHWTHVFYRDLNDNLASDLYRIRKLDYTIAPLQCISFLDVPVYIPSNFEIYLEEIYGSNWRIPDPNYDWRKGPKSNCTLENIFGKKI